MNTKPNTSLIYMLSFLSGLLSLGIEVLWVRMFSFAAQSVPQAFSFTLACFLTGIAVGAYFGKRICRSRFVDIPFIGQCFLWAGIADFLILGAAWLLTGFSGFVHHAGIFITLSAVVRGLIFPLVHHVGTDGNKSGRQVSNVYFANVVGSALGPVLIGFVILDFLSTQQIYLLICLISAAVPLFCTPFQKSLRLNAVSVAVSLMFGILMFLLPDSVFQNIADRPDRLIENKHGIVAVYHRDGDKVVYGANVYDGAYNTDIFNSVNGIERAYLPPSLKSGIRRIFVVGLSTGSWARVLSAIPEMQSMIVAEINPAYRSTTHSPHAFATAVHSIPYAYRYGHMVVGSATPVVFPNKELLKQRLSRLIWPESGRHVFDSSTVDAAAQKVVSRMLIRMTEPSAGAEVITDDNMIVEYKYGRGI
ncbi:membrane protein [Neisseria gonorrhoeae]|nr:membrane protein [Neisseria gonorrhoeae]